jgi:hypothetical protein
MKRRAFIPSSFVLLEQRIALSQAEFASAPALPAPALMESQSLNLYGLALGHDKTVGAVHRLKSTVSTTVSPLGTISLTGTLVIPHKRGANRVVHGTVSISNAQGSVVVSLAGTVRVYKGLVPFASGNLSYKIVSGTGAYQGATGSGPVLYGPGPVLGRGRFLLDFGNYPPPP